jgi:L-rhamnose-H+ transport protein
MVEMFTQPAGQAVLAGIAVCLAGIAVCGWAGMSKEAELR